MTRTWLSIRVELVSGRGEDLWPRPGRILAAARRHTFAQLAEAIDDAFVAGRIDPVDELGILPDEPLPYWGWGAIPDQYGRRWDSDDGESPAPADPGLAELPPLLPWWGAQECWERS